MHIAIVTFDGFTDIDVVLPWDLLNRVRDPGWSVRLVGASPRLRSSTGLELGVHGPLGEANEADAVLFASGPATRALCQDAAFLGHFRLDPSRQLVGAMCSGALLLAGLGLLAGKRATTYPTARARLASMGVEVVERPFVREGNVATAAGCLAALELAGWVIETALGADARRRVLRSVQPVGEGLAFTDEAEVAAAYAPAAPA